MAAKQEFLEAVEDEEDTKFLQLVEKHCARSDPFDIDDIISSLDRKHLVDVWQQLQRKCNRALLSFNTEDDAEEHDLGDVSKVLQGIIMVAMATIQMEKPIVVPEMLETAIVLHGILMPLPDTEVKLATAIVRLCETWVKAELEGSANLCDQTLQWLLYKTCEEKTTQANIKKVWGLRQALLRIDIDQPSAAQLKAVLLTTLISPNYLKLDEGRRFLAFLFTLKVSFVEEIHKTIKNQLPQSKKSLLSLYGEVYFRAWRAAEGATKEKIEHYCIQDLMYRAVHAPRGGDSGSLASVLRIVMSYLHKQKIHPGVDQLLLRLYEPILWRSLKVANPHVRANAAALLVDVFPLRDPEGAAADVDNLLQRQIDALQTLLYDPNVTVRATVVRGVCMIVSQYWEYLPNTTITWFINRLVADLAWDASSPEVRACVLQGMGRILDNHLSHPMLKVLLPELRNLLHDTSEVVRVAFLDLLLKVKGIRSIKFWSVAPMEHLLARLEGDSNTIMRRIVSLIFYSFMPTDKPVDTQLGRCIMLLQTNAKAARWFYRFSHDKMPLVNTVKFMIAVCRCVLTCVRKEQGDEDASRVEDDEEAEAEKEQEKENVGDSEDDSELSVTNTDVMAGLLETVVILWEGIKDRLQKPTNSDLKERLQLRVSQALPEFYRAFSDHRVEASLTLLAGFLPPNNIPTFSRTMLAKLRGLDEETEEEVYSTMLESMCKWGKAADIIELITEWFETTLVVTDEDATLNKSRKKGGVQFAEPVVARPQLALCYTRYLIRSTVCQQVLLTHHQNHLATLTRALSNVTHCVEQRLQAPEPLSEELSDDFLQDTFDLYCRLEILLHDRENKDHNAVTVMEHLVTWADAELLHCLRHRRQAKRRLLNQTDMTLLADADTNTTLSTTVMMSQTLNTTLSTTLGGSKRTAGEVHAPAVVQLATKLVKTLLGITSNMLLVGVADQELLSQLANFSESLLKTDESVVFLEQVAVLLYQITELSATWDVGQREDDDEGVASHSDVVPGMLSKMINAVSTLTRNKREQAERILPGIKSSVGQTLQAYYRNPIRPDSAATPGHDVMSTLMAAIVREMTDTVKKEPEFERCDKVTSLPLLSNFLLSAIGRRKNINRLLVEQLHASVTSGTTTELEGLLAVLHLVHTVSLNAAPVSELKQCLTAVQTQFETVTLPDDLSEDSSYRSMHASTKLMLTDCMTRIGMVA